MQADVVYSADNIATVANYVLSLNEAKILVGSYAYVSMCVCNYIKYVANHVSANKSTQL